MKFRNGFVSNSSSTSYTIINKSNKDLTLVHFLAENPQLIDEYNEEYDYKHTQFKLLFSAYKNDVIFPANSTKKYIFSDNSGTLVGEVLDYILRDGGESENFIWKFKESLR